MPGADEQHHEHNKSQEQTPQNLLANELHVH